MRITIAEEPASLDLARLETIVRRGRATDGEIRALAADLGGESAALATLASGGSVSDDELAAALDAVRDSAPDTVALLDRFLRDRREDPWLNPLGAGTPPF